MENFEQQLPVQQSVPQEDLSEEELLSIERTKELFEYEMTQVLLNFRMEVSDIKKNVTSEYLDMEVPKASVDYSPPDIQLKTIDFSLQDKTISLDIPKQEAIKVSVGIGKVPATQMSPFSLPDLSAGVSGQKSVIVQVPDTSFSGNVFNISPLVGQQSAAGTSVPDTNINTAAFNATKVDLPQVSVDVAPTASTAFSAIPAAKAVSAPAVSSIPEVSSFDGMDNISIPEISVSVGNVSPAAIPELMTEKTVAPPVISVSVAETSQWTLPVIPQAAAITAPESIISADDVRSFDQSAFPAAKTQPVEYPDIPEKPDFSMYYSDILEALKAEI